MKSQAEKLYLRRLTLDEALPKLEHFLNDAFLQGHSSVRIIHGKGTGTIREAVHRQLEGHPLVQSFRMAEVYQGGAGVTIIEMANIYHSAEIQDNGHNGIDDLFM